VINPEETDVQGEFDLGLPALPKPAVDLTWPPHDERLHGYSELPHSRLSGFSTGLFVQAYGQQARDAARLAMYSGVGCVFTVDHWRRSVSALHQVIGGIETVRRRTASNNLLVDHNCYSGRNRKLPEHGLSKNWIHQQHSYLQLPWATTDSGYISSPGDVRRVLSDGEQLAGQVVVALPMDFTVLRDEASSVVDMVNAQQHPVAVMLGHEADPFDEPGVAAGLTHLIAQVNVPVLLLRSDTSALGALGHGAAVGAVGTRSGLRHIYPIKTGGGPEKLSFVIPELMGYYREQRFAQAYLRDPDRSEWRCSCWFCAGRDLVWISNQAEQLADRAAFQHSVTAVAQMGAELAAHVPAIGGPQTWAVMCARAQKAHEEIANPTGSRWEPKAAQGHWIRAVPTPAEQR
jgi:hypothetical protein